MRDTSIVNEDFEPLAALMGSLHEVPDVSFVGQVGADDLSSPTGGGYLPSGRLQIGLGATRQDNRRAVGRERDRYRSADPTTGAGHERYFPFETLRHRKTSIEAIVSGL